MGLWSCSGNYDLKRKEEPYVSACAYVCVWVFGAVTGGMPVKMPQEFPAQAVFWDAETWEELGLWGSDVFESAGRLHINSCSNYMIGSKTISRPQFGFKLDFTGGKKVIMWPLKMLVLILNHSV